MIRSIFEPETKYDEFVTQLEDYMRHDQMPANIQKRLKLFYKDRFQGTYFKESAIMSSLSGTIIYLANSNLYNIQNLVTCR